MQETEKHRTFSLYMSDALHTRLVAAANVDRRKKTELARLLIEEGLDRLEQKRK
jgi:hypothetical protein